MHDSVPNFFIAKFLFDSMSAAVAPLQYRKLAEDILTVTGACAYIPVAITDFVEYFVRSSRTCDYKEPVRFLKAFLSDELSDILTVNGNISLTHQFYYNLFVDIVRLVISFIHPTMKSFSQFDLFGELNESEKKRFIFYSLLGNL